jgi:integrase
VSVQLREKKLLDGRKSLYLDIYFKGRRTYEFLELYLTVNRQSNKETRELAENIRAKRQLEIQSGAHGFAPDFKKKVDFLEYFKKVFEDKKRFEGLRGVTNYEGTIRHLETFIGKKPVPIASIDEKWLEEFKQHLASSMKQNTANNYYARVKAVLRRAQKDGFININPSDNVKYFPSPEVQKDYLTAEELQRLADAPCKNADIKRAFLFACFTGLRFSDIKALTWGDIKSGKIHFRQRKTQGFEYLPLNETCQKILSQCRTGNELPLPEKNVFNIPDKGHINGEKMKSWLKAAKIKKHITFHCSRHTFATSLLTSGADLYTTSKLLGHKSISSTAIYAKIVDEKKQNAVNSLPRIEVAV